MIVLILAYLVVSLLAISIVSKAMAFGNPSGQRQRDRV